MAATRTHRTTNHDEIRKWVEKNGGAPARVKATGRSKNDPGILRIDYPGFSGQDTLVKMDWDEWFSAFDASKLAFVYQPTTRFSKLVARTTARTGRSATAARRTGAKKSTARGAKRTARRATTAKKRATTRPAKRTTKRTTKRTSGRRTGAGRRSRA